MDANNFNISNSSDRGNMKDINNINCCSRCGHCCSNSNNSISNNKIVKLNIGGIKYLTTKETLLSRGDNFFSPLLNGSIPSITDDKGYIFIDRNGRYFEYILDYLRSGVVDVPEGVSLSAIFREADFFMVLKGFQLQWLEQQMTSSSSSTSRKSSQNELVTVTTTTTELTTNNDEVPNNNNIVNQTTTTTTNIRRTELVRWNLGGLVEKLLKIY